MRGWDRDDDERERPDDTPATHNRTSGLDTPKVGRRQRASHTHREPDERRDPLELPRGPGRARDYVRTLHATYRLRGSEVEALKIIGTFRSVDVSHLQRFAYGDDRGACAADQRNLEVQGLIERRPILADGRPAHVVALTRAAHRLLLASQPERDQPDERVAQQRYYSGFVRPRDLVHDVSVYPMVERERAKLDAEGLRTTRVVLETELTSTMLRAWELARRDRASAHYFDRPPEEDLKRAIAQAHGLPLIGDHFQFPDVRLELERPNREPTHVDLELVTRYYHGVHLSLKAQAGFRLYAPHNRDVMEYFR